MHFTQSLPACRQRQDRKSKFAKGHKIQERLVRAVLTFVKTLGLGGFVAFDCRFTILDFLAQNRTCKKCLEAL